MFYMVFFKLCCCERGCKSAGRATSHHGNPIFWTGAIYLRDYYKRVELRDLYTLTFFFFARIAEKAQLPVFGVERRCNESIQCSSYVPEGPAQVEFCAS